MTALANPSLQAAAADVEAFVLAGGRSSRMGQEKALVSLHGRPLIRIALETLLAAGMNPRIAGARTSLSSFAPVIPDLIPDCGPLSGIHASLAASSAELCLFLPVDLPLMPPALLQSLLQRAQITGSSVTLCRLNGQIQPLPVLLRRTVLESLELCLQQGVFQCHRAWNLLAEASSTLPDAVTVEFLAQCGQVNHPLGLPPVLWFQNCNSPSQLADLDRLLGSEIPRKSNQ